MNPFSQLSDEKLMSLYRDGENMAFEILYSRHSNKVFSYLRRRVSGDYEINEIHQNIFMKLHRNRTKYQTKFEFVKWLYTICRWELLDFLKIRKLDLIPLDETNIPGKIERQDGKIDIENSKIHNEKEKKALILKYYSDYDYEEISEVLGLSQANTRKILSRGIAKLKSKYQGEQDE